MMIMRVVNCLKCFLFNVKNKVLLSLFNKSDTETNSTVSNESNNKSVICGYSRQEKEILIEDLNLSYRATKCLITHGYKYASDLTDLTFEELIKIRNMGTKTAHEVLVRIRELSTQNVNVQKNQRDQTVIVGFLDNKTGACVQDFTIKDLKLSVRATNSLINHGYKYASDLVGLTFYDLKAIQNMGTKTAHEVLERMEQISIKGKRVLSETDTNDKNDLAVEMSKMYGKTTAFWHREFATVTENFQEASGDIFLTHLYKESAITRGYLKEKILQIVGENDGVPRSNIDVRLPSHLANTNIIEDVLIELEKTCAIYLEDGEFFRQYPSIVEFATGIEDSRTRDIVQSKLNGKTLEELADKYDITRQGVHQILKNGMKHKPHVREDAFYDVFNKYCFSAKEFETIFEEPSTTYYYLKFVTTTPMNQRMPLEDLPNDMKIARKYRERIEQFINRNSYFFFDGVPIERTRIALLEFYIKHFCQVLTKFEIFYVAYQSWLKTLQAEDWSDLLFEYRSCENILRDSRIVLWNYGRAFRYYNLSERDPKDLFTTLDLGNLEFGEHSTLNLFEKHPLLMKQYDIRDGYELHNFLKKMWHIGDESIKFKRMPIIERRTTPQEPTHDKEHQCH